MMDYSSLYQQIVFGYSKLSTCLPSSHALPPLQVFIEVTYRCNLSCQFCQFREKGKFPQANHSRELTCREFQEILKDVPGRAIVSFTGGEPFVKNGFQDLLAQISRKNKTHIFTNGTLIDQEAARRLIALGAGNILGKGLVLVGISLEGLEEAHDHISGREGSFQKTISCIEALISHRRRANKKYPLIELKTVISESNVGQLHDLFSLSESLGVDVFNIMVMNQLPHASRISDHADGGSLSVPPQPVTVNLDALKEQLAAISRDLPHSRIQIRTSPQRISFQEIVNYYAGKMRLQDYHCFYPWYGVGISAFGETLICPYVITGSVKQDRLKDLFNSAVTREFRNALQRSKIFPGCYGCCMLTPRIRAGRK